jgi:hypothetical protein
MVNAGRAEGLPQPAAPHVEAIAAAYLAEAGGDRDAALRRVIADALADLTEMDRRTQRLVSRVCEGVVPQHEGTVMFTESKDLARAALRLLDLANSPEIESDFDKGALELAAATLANHVRDWHYRERVDRDARWDEFKARYPDWDLLRQVSNGTKHAKAIVQDATRPRQVKWEDRDFWSAWHSPDARTLFVDMGGEQRSVRAAIINFCTAYLDEAAK